MPDRRIPSWHLQSAEITFENVLVQIYFIWTERGIVYYQEFARVFLHPGHSFRNSHRTISGILHRETSIWNYLPSFTMSRGQIKVSGTFPGNHSWICITQARQSVSRAASALLLDATDHRGQANRISAIQAQKQGQGKFFRMNDRRHRRLTRRRFVAPRLSRHNSSITFFGPIETISEKPISYHPHRGRIESLILLSILSQNAIFLVPPRGRLKLEFPTSACLQLYYHSRIGRECVLHLVIDDVSCQPQSINKGKGRVDGTRLSFTVAS